MSKKINLFLIIFAIILLFITFKHEIISYVKLAYANVLAQPQVNPNNALINKLEVKQTPATKINIQYTHNNNTTLKKETLKPKNNLNECLPATNLLHGNKSYYTLVTNLNNKASPFIHELNHKLSLAFQHIENSLNINLYKNIQLTMVFKMNNADYENYVMQHGRSVGGHQGLYLFPEHIAIINATEHSLAIKIALHEAVHAFNQSYWGYSLRFLNEGMAQYFENITINGTIPPFNFSALAHQQYPMQISTLLFSDTDWHSDHTNTLYLNSKALFYFLMSNFKGRQVIKKVMLLEKEMPCSTLSKSTFEEVLFDIFPNHQQAFDYWFSDGVSKFLQHHTN